MQLDAIEHFNEIILAALADYRQAEDHLSRTIVEKHEEPVRIKAQYAALRLGGAAAIYVHHFADVVANRPPDGFPAFKGNVHAVRDWLVTHKENSEVDLTLLGDVADALKHAILTHRLPREVHDAGQVLAVDRRFGSGKFGEGKFGGIDEVWILAKSGRRPLTSVLRSITELWQIAIHKQ